MLLWPIPVPPGWGVLAHVSVDLEVLEVFCVGVSVVGGAEPEAWSTCLPVSLAVDDNLADEEPRPSGDAVHRSDLSSFVVDRSRVGVDDLPADSILIGQVRASPDPPSEKDLAGDW